MADNIIEGETNIPINSDPQQDEQRKSYIGLTTFDLTFMAILTFFSIIDTWEHIIISNPTAYKFTKTVYLLLGAMIAFSARLNVNLSKWLQRYRIIVAYVLAFLALLLVMNFWSCSNGAHWMSIFLIILLLMFGVPYMFKCSTCSMVLGPSCTRFRCRAAKYGWISLCIILCVVLALWLFGKFSVLDSSKCWSFGGGERVNPNTPCNFKFTDEQT